MIKLAFGVPAYGRKVVADHIVMAMRLQAEFERGELVDADLVMVGYVDTHGVDRARNRLIAEAMMAGADWLLMVDADTWVVAREGDDAGVQLGRMINDARKLDAAVIAAPVQLRSGYALAVYEDDGSGRNLAHKQVPREIVAVHAVGAACMAIDLNKVAAARASFRFTDKLGEDLEFCRQMREAGHKIYVDGRVKTAHLSQAVPLYSE